MAESPEATPTLHNSPPADDNSAPPPADPTESPPPPDPEPDPEPSAPPKSPPLSPPQSPPPAHVPPPKSSSSPPPPSPEDSAPPPPSLPPQSPDRPVRPPPQPKSPPKPFAPPIPPSGGLAPPSPRTPSKPSPPDRTPPDSGTPSNKDHSNAPLPLVLGLIIGIGLFVVIIALVLCSKRKKKSPNNGMPYFDAPGPKGGYYYNGGPLPKWQNGGQGMEYGGILPPPPGAWGQTPSPPGMCSGEMSLNNSGPYGTSLPPPSPSVALGFSKSSFTYDELAAATNGFSKENLLGQGGFGFVHKGVLPNGTVVAVKQLKSGSGQGEREFQAEVEIISRVHHRHLVSLVGYCTAGAQRMLVYEFVPNNTLEHHLHGKGQPTMEWSTRLKIAIGSAKGLAYLHEDCHPRIIHRDIKTANILLDNNFEAMVADFGLAKFTSDTNTHVSTRIMGTFGYLAPEYASTGKLTEKSDVYSFGVMLLELITGRRPVDNYMEESLAEWSRPLLTQAINDERYDELADPRLENRYDTAEMARMVASAVACVRHSAKRRPKMSQIVRALDGDVSLDDLNKSGQSTVFTAGSDSETYSAKMRQFRKLAFESTECSNDYSVGTSDCGMNPSEASSSGEMSSAGSRTTAAPHDHKF